MPDLQCVGLELRAHLEAEGSEQDECPNRTSRPVALAELRLPQSQGECSWMSTF